MSGDKRKILIVEDEPIIASDIEMTLEDLGYEVTGIADSAEEALEFLANELPDLVLLDIQLEGDTDGIMLAEDIKKMYQIPFVFLTSNADNLTINRVKRTEPAGFIVKPFSDRDLQSNIEIALFSNKEEEPKPTQNEFYVKDKGAYVKVKVAELMFVQADDNYSRLFTTKKNFILSSTLKVIEGKLPTKNFVRIHRSYIVNISFVDKIQDGYLHIGSHQLPIGRSYHDHFFQKINKF